MNPVRIEKNTADAKETTNARGWGQLPAINSQKDARQRDFDIHPNLCYHRHDLWSTSRAYVRNCKAVFTQEEKSYLILREW